MENLTFIIIQKGFAKMTGQPLKWDGLTKKNENDILLDGH